MENKDLTARELEVLKAKNALSAKEVAEMDDFSIKIKGNATLDFNDCVDLYADEHNTPNEQR